MCSGSWQQSQTTLVLVLATLGGIILISYLIELAVGFLKGRGTTDEIPK